MEFLPTLSTHYLQTSRLWGFDCSELPTEDTYLSRQMDRLSWINFDSQLGDVTTGVDSDEHSIVLNNKNLALLPRTIDEPGFFCMNIPDGTVLGGNARGMGSVDLQTYREEADQVASGYYSTIGGGEWNQASGDYSTVIGGSDSIVAGTHSIVVGLQNTVSGHNSTLLGGVSSTVTGDNSTMVPGLESILDTDNAVAVGVRDEDSTSIFSIGSYPTNGYFEIDDDGTVHADDYSDTGADYAEMYESQLEHKIPVGTTIVFETDIQSNIRKRYIRPCRPDEVPVGVISDTGGVVLNAAHSHWHDKYITTSRTVDVTKIVTETVEYKVKMDMHKNNKRLGELAYRDVPIYDTVDVHDVSGNVIDQKQIPRTEKVGTKIVKQRTINPQWDSSKRYIPRADRPEWNVVGLLGKCKVLHNQPINPRWIHLKEDDIYDTYLIR